MQQPQEQRTGFDEPKIQFTIKLIEAQEQISYLINISEFTLAAKAIATLLMRLDIQEDEKELFELKKKLTLETYTTYEFVEIEKAFTALNAFLNHTYFADFRKPKPKHGTGPL